MQRQADMTKNRMLEVERLAVLGALALGVGMGCTQFEQGTDTLPTVGENPLRDEPMEMPAAELGAEWSCLGLPIDRTPAPGTPGALVVYSLRLVDLASGEPFTASTIRLCGLTDITCASPLMDQLKPDADGWIDVQLSANFLGYLEIESVGAVPYIFQLPDDGIRNMRDFPVVMIGLENFGALLSALGVQYDPTLGAIGLRSFDCQGAPAPGIALRTQGGGTPFYFDNGLPNTMRQQTDPGGLAGFIGSVPGVAVVESELGDGTITSTKSMIIRAGWMTVGFMRPRQATGG
jgi:hypothetical protein